MRPLDRFTSLKLKLGAVIVAATATTVAVVGLGVRAGLPLIACGVLAGLLSLAMIQLLARGMTSPLREMAEAARAMARGDYGLRVSDTSRDEVGELARAFNKMAADLAEVDRVRRDLIANVSHDLRTPISALRAVLENLVDEVGSADPATLKGMLGQAERLGRLVDQLLELSRLESGAAGFNPAPFRIASVLRQVTREAELASARPGSASVRLAFAVEPEDLEVDGDAERVHQVMTNIVQNALQHSPDGGLVDVRAGAGDGAVVITVTDQGPGIDAGESERVFERFYRSDAARAARDGGSGLGLAIAKWIVDLHGGAISVGRAEEGGCRMVVELPRAT